MPDTVQRESIDRPERPERPEQTLHFQLICKQRLRTQPGLLT